MNFLSIISLLTALTATCAQFFPNFNSQQRQPQNQFGFPQFGIFNPGNFFFPDQNYQQPQYTQQQPQYTQQPQQRPPQNPTNRPQQQNTPARPPPQNPTRPQQQNVNERVSERKCRDYANVLKNRVPVGSLSLDGSVQNIAVDTCDGSTGLIVGGEDAKRGEFPHMAALGYPDGLDSGTVSFKCGGSLISDQFVLTAAHCKKADRVSPTVARLGDLNLRTREPDLPETDIPIVQFISHERYNKQSSHNDIALVKLDRRIQFQKFLRPACLATPRTQLKPKAIASGWGFTEVGGRTADHLQKVELAIIDNNKCRSLYDDQENYNIDDTQLCAGELAGGKDTCQGDSGGPMQITSDKNKCMYTIIGITSYGPTFCGSANQPGIYTKVSAYLDWIERKVWPNQ